MAEPRRRRKKASAPQDVVQLRPYITITAPVYDILSDQQAIAIEDTADDIPESVGVEVRHEPGLQLLKEAGCHVESERVTFERGF